MISVLILTGNEEMNLPRCLDSVRWSNDVLVLDCFSTDRTVEIAEATGARVIQRRFDTFADQRNFGIRNGAMRHDWVLHLDADEVVTPALHDELQRIAVSGDKDAYRLAVVQKDYPILKDAEEFAATLIQRMKLLVIEYDAAVNSFVGTTTAVISS